MSIKTKNKQSPKRPRTKTIPASELSNIKMVVRKDEPPTIIHQGMVKDWVGIGWITVRKATAADKRKFPVVIEGK